MLVSKEEYIGATIIDEVSDCLQYIGYATNGSPKETDESWAIKRIEKTDTITRITWVDGLQTKKYQWSERANYEYKFKQ